MSDVADEIARVVLELQQRMNDREMAGELADCLFDLDHELFDVGMDLLSLRLDENSFESMIEDKIQVDPAHVVRALDSIARVRTYMPKFHAMLDRVEALANKASVSNPKTPKA